MLAAPTAESPFSEQEWMEDGKGSTRMQQQASSAASRQLMRRQDGILFFRPFWQLTASKVSEVALATAKDAAVAWTGCQSSSIAAPRAPRTRDAKHDILFKVCLSACLQSKAKQPLPTAVSSPFSTQANMKFGWAWHRAA